MTHLLPWIAVALVTAYALGVAIYVWISYLAAITHHEPRPLAHHVGHAFWEGLLSFLVEPLLPLYYVIGRRMGGPARGQPVVFVHGYLQNRVIFIGLARRLARRGVGPLYGFNYASYQDIQRSADRLSAFIEGVCQEQGTPTVDLVCHSLGGIVGAEYTRAHPERVRCCVTVASPHAGVAWRGPLFGQGGNQLRREGAFLVERASKPIPVPLLSIYSTHDNVVYPKETSARIHIGGRDVVIGGVGHLAALFEARTADEIATFLGDVGAAAPR